ncbi:MAG: U32 family peptidase [Spirochaetales bacterium]|nr:U32 family peptidase [Spirochaetales bacterium]
MTDLSLPAGSLQAALQAFAGGATSVYLGLKAFSARKGATNFTLEEVAKLKGEAVKQGKKIYVALNTLLEDEELKLLRPTIKELELLQVDALIVQDLGLASLLRDEFPTLPLHSSTQIATHTVRGVNELQHLGFSRVVLSRELSFEELKKIREACPSVELKVFIHGALCYGSSGLCMASNRLTGRSANRGECAQICRTWFNHQRERGYYFSMSDLHLGENVVKLNEIGIDALKVEGRMKSPDYAYYAARYYSDLLEGREADPTNLLTQFSRTPTQGWTFNRFKDSLVDTLYPSHRGVVAGKVIASQKGSVTVMLEREIAIRDGLLLFIQGRSEQFSLQGLHSENNTPLLQGERGERVKITLPFKEEAAVGELLYQTSKHDTQRPLISEAALKAYRHPVDLTLNLREGELEVKRGNYTLTYPISIQKAERPQSLEDNLVKLFLAGGERFVGGNISFNNTTPLKEAEIFLPLSQLKDIRRSFYGHLDAEAEKEIGAHFVLPEVEGRALPSRELISPPYDSGIPWIDTVDALSMVKGGRALEEVVAKVDGHFYLPLAPVMFDEELYLKALEELLGLLGDNVRIGLNNVAHLNWARENSDYTYFGDIYLYGANRASVELYHSLVSNLQGVYPWVERTSLPLPLFISRSCFRYDSLNQSCKGCSKRHEYSLEQSGKHYRVVVRNCVTLLLEEPVKEG